MHLFELEFFPDICPQVLSKEPPYCSPWWLYQSTLPPTVLESSLFSTPSPKSSFYRLFTDGHSEGIWFAFLEQLVILSFHQPVGHFYILFGEMSIQAFCPFFLLGSLLLLFFNIKLKSIFWKLTPCWQHHLQIFSPACMLSFCFMVFFAVQKFLSIIRPHFSIFVLINLGDESKKSIAIISQKRTAYVFLQEFYSIQSCTKVFNPF